MRLPKFPIVAATLLVVASAPGCGPRATRDTGAAKAAHGRGAGTTVGATEGKREPRSDGATGTRAPEPVAWSEGTQAVADGAGRFAIAHYLRLADGADDLVFSPFSIHAALSMTACGARGATLEQLRSALHLPEADRLGDVGDLARFYASGDRPYELAVASALWGQSGLAWQPDFLALMAERFAAGFQEAGFAADPDGARQRVNAWVADRTR